MRLIDAYRRGTITYDEYIDLLSKGLTPNDTYSIGSIPTPTPTNAWTEILAWDVDGMGTKSIAIYNLDTAYSMYSKAEIYIDDIIARTEYATININDVYTYIVADPCTDIVISVRSSLYGRTASYDFAYTNSY